MIRNGRREKVQNAWLFLSYWLVLHYLLILLSLFGGGTVTPLTLFIQLSFVSSRRSERQHCFLEMSVLEAFERIFGGKTFHMGI